MAKKGLLLCVCQGSCPSFQKMNIFEVGNAIRREKLVDYVAVHPQLCAKDGDVFLDILMKGDGKEDQLYVAACDPVMQLKMFKSVMDAAEFKEENIHGADIRNMSTEEAIAAVKQMLAKNA